MKTDRTLLVLGDHGTSMSRLGERARDLGFRVVRAKTPQDALDLAEERGFRYGAALVDAEMPVMDMGEALKAIRVRTDSADLVYVAAGGIPEPGERERLREAGIELALWEPIGDHALRFQLNRAMSGRKQERVRGGLRVPGGDWNVRLWSAGTQKLANVYSLSAGGAYLATRRPSPRGAGMAVELRLPQSTVTVAGQVVYTNVPGNLMKRALPLGMAVTFSDEAPEDLDSIARAIAARVPDFLI